MPSRSARTPLVAIAAALALAAAAHGQLRVATWNAAQLQGDAGAIADVLTALADDDRPGFAVAPAILVFQEVRGADLGPLASLVAAAAPPGVTYATATYTNFGEDGVSGAQALFYRPDLLAEIPADHADLSTGAGRWSDRWHLQLVGYDAPGASLWVYSCHLKSSSGGANEAERLAGVQTIRADADALGADARIVFAGDMNFGHNGEPGYGAFLAAGAAQAVDPLGSGSWSGAAHAIAHTQSPLATTPVGTGLVGGGVDDRFDFQLVTQELVDGTGLDLVAGAYRAVGNDGAHYDVAINDGANGYFPGEPARSDALADALHDASDHLPLLADYRVPAALHATVAPGDVGRVIVGADVAVTVSVTNVAPAVTPLGADLLDWQVLGTGSLLGGCSGDLPALAGPATCDLGVVTVLPGPLGATAVAFSNGDSVANDVVMMPVTGTIVRAAQPSFDAVDVVIADAIATALPPDGGVQPLGAALHNVGWDALQAALDLDAVDGVAAPFVLTGPLPAGVEGAPAPLPLGIDTDGLAPGDHVAALVLHVSDEDLPGAGAAEMMLDVTVTIDGAPCPADVTGDGAVDVADLVEVILSWGACPGCAADIDGNDAVDVSDLVAVVLAWGPC